MQIVASIVRRPLFAMALIALALLTPVAVPVGAVSAVKSLQMVRAQKQSCTIRSANGTGISSKAARFQVYEGLLKATDVDAWAVWMANGKTPGFAVKNLKYRCTSGSGLGVSCRGRAKICKL